MKIQEIGRGLRRPVKIQVMENILDVPFMTIKDYERLKKQHEDKAVQTDMYGNLIRPYTLH
jgi:hypothetical protein